jgi:hypothetical protein
MIRGIAVAAKIKFGIVRRTGTNQFVARRAPAARRAAGQAVEDVEDVKGTGGHRDDGYRERRMGHRCGPAGPGKTKVTPIRGAQRDQHEHAKPPILLPRQQAGVASSVR